MEIELIEKARVPQDLTCRISLAEPGDRVLAWLDSTDEEAVVVTYTGRASISARLNATACRDLAAFLLTAADELEARNG